MWIYILPNDFLGALKMYCVLAIILAVICYFGQCDMNRYQKAMWHKGRIFFVGPFTKAEFIGWLIESFVFPLFSFLMPVLKPMMSDPEFPLKAVMLVLTVWFLICFLVAPFLIKLEIGDDEIDLDEKKTDLDPKEFRP